MTFLFDIGRVLLDFDFESSLARLFPPGTAGCRRAARAPAGAQGRVRSRRDRRRTTYIAWALEVLGSRCHARRIPPRLAADLHSERADVGTRAQARRRRPPAHPFLQHQRHPLPVGVRGVSGVLPLPRGRALLRDRLHQTRAGNLSTRHRRARPRPGGDPLHRRPPAKHRHRPRARLPLLAIRPQRPRRLRDAGSPTI